MAAAAWLLRNRAGRVRERLSAVQNISQTKRTDRRCGLLSSWASCFAADSGWDFSGFDPRSTDVRGERLGGGLDAGRSCSISCAHSGMSENSSCRPSPVNTRPPVPNSCTVVPLPKTRQACFRSCVGVSCASVAAGRSLGFFIGDANFPIACWKKSGRRVARRPMNSGRIRHMGCEWRGDQGAKVFGSNRL
jgi:hypothetical protein